MRNLGKSGLLFAVLVMAALAPHTDAAPVRGTILRVVDDSPVAGVRVRIRELITDVAVEGLSGPDGTWVLELPPGVYGGWVSGAPGTAPADRIAPAPVDEFGVDGTRPVRIPTIRVGPGFELRGTVEDENGAALPGALVLVRDVRTPETLSGADGTFRLDLPPGVHDVELHAPPGAALASHVEPGVVVDADVVLPATGLQPGVPVSGTAVSPEGSPLSHVRVRAEHAPAGGPVAVSPTPTGLDGRFAFRVAPGTYRLTLEPARRTWLDDGRTVVTVDEALELGDVGLPYHNEDGDLFVDVADTCPFRNSLFQQDFDQDGRGGLCDNCPLVANPRQENNDGTGGGDACDPDDDDDGLTDAADTDRDGDELPDADDNCPGARNPGQADFDRDGEGDACDADDGLVQGVEMRTPSGMRWAPEENVDGYRAYRFPLEPRSAINYGACLHETAGPVTFLRDPEVPLPGRAFAYVVTSWRAGVEGAMGSGAGGVRPNLRPCVSD